MAKMHPIVDFYTESESRNVMATTNTERVKKLNLWLRMMEEDFGVEVLEEGFVGLTAPKLQRWYNKFADGRTMSTLNNYVCMINPFLRWCHRLRYTQEDFSNVLHTGRLPSYDELPEEERPMDKYLTHEQAEALLAVDAGCNRPRDRAIIALILYSGLRTEELCSLRVKDVVGKPHGEIEVKRKGGHYRKVLVGEKAYEYLDAYLATRKDRYTEDSPLFMTERGNPCNPNQVYRALRKKQSTLGLAVGGHALRHTFVSEIEKLGGAGIARDLANHHSLHVTNRYTHTTKQQREAAIQALNW